MPRIPVKISNRKGVADETVLADVRGPLALVRRATGKARYLQHWSITHVATGLCVVRCYTSKRIAMQALRLLRSKAAIPWTDPDLVERVTAGEFEDAFNTAMSYVEERLHDEHRHDYHVRVSGNRISADPRPKR